jgi:outer membrane immunogenic protein
MLRKSGLIGIALLTFSGLGWANLDYCDNWDYCDGWESWDICGFYVGAGLGPEMVDYKQKRTVLNSDTNVLANSHLGGKGGFFSIFAGYEFDFCGFCSEDSFSLGLELNGNLATLKYRALNDEFVHQSFAGTYYKMGNSYGVSVLPGYYFNDCTQLYARLGYSNRHLAIITQDVSLFNVKKNRSGYRYGLGMKQALCDGFSVRLEYSEAVYKKVRLFVIDTANGSGTQIDTSVKPYTGSFEVGLTYSF